MEALALGGLTETGLLLALFGHAALVASCPLRHQPGIVTLCLKFATEMMRADASFHADQAWRHIGKAGLHLATRPLLPQHDGTTLIVAYDVERVLADIDANRGDFGFECLGHGVLLVFGAPCQFRSLAEEHGRTITLTEIASLQFGLPAIEVEPRLAVHRPAYL
jgi:hypothetical protein